MDTNSITLRMNQISDAASARMANASMSPDGHWSGHSFMTKDEIAEFHELRQKLPTFAQLRSEAQTRLKEKLAKRNAAK
jgi:hypothetical protein